MTAFVNPGGINLNAAASLFLDPLHRIEKIVVRRFLRHDIEEDGTKKPVYGDPFEIEAQIQDPSNSQLRHVNKLNENGLQRQFWVNEILEPIDRMMGHAGDVILYDGYTWYVTARPDNFVKQGWVSVIAEAVLNDPQGT